MIDVNHTRRRTLYSSAFLRSSTTSRYHVCAMCPPFTKVLLSILFSSPAKPKFSLSVSAFLSLISYAYCENGRTDRLVGNSLFLHKKCDKKFRRLNKPVCINLFKLHTFRVSLRRTTVPALEWMLLKSNQNRQFYEN